LYMIVLLTSKVLLTAGQFLTMLSVSARSPEGRLNYPLREG
jgi:hypothetical protein